MSDRIQELKMEIFKLKGELAQAIVEREDEVVEDWELTDLGGNGVKLSALFGEKSELLVIHNMGRGCNYCSLWGDAMMGVAPHLMERCQFVLCSNDPVDVVKEFKDLRGWDYPCVSGSGSGFARAMGYMNEDGGPLPGVSAFHKRDDGVIVRTGDAPFGPGDDFCAVWPMLDLIKGGKGEWEPARGEVGGCCQSTQSTNSSGCGCS